MSTTPQTPSIPLAEIRNGRIAKAETLRSIGINPYPSRSGRTHYSRPILDDYEGHEGKTVTVAGRLMSWREGGALSFGHIQDQTGRIQLFLRRDSMPETDPAAGTLGYSQLGLIDVGDIVEATGAVMKTKRGETSVQVDRLRLLTKSIRPLPDKWAGVRDRETVLRKRYLDVTMEPEHRERFEQIARLVYTIRSFLDRRGFLEIHTPVIQPQYGGGTAKPFMTHVNALDCDMYLAISHELYLKRLIVAGCDKVFTIGRYFRNEGIDRSHHPEFTMIETMTAYENYEYNMALIEDLFREVAVGAFGRTEFTVAGHPVDFGKPWRRLLMADAVRDATGIDFREVRTLDEAHGHLRGLGVNEPQESVGHALVRAFEEKVEATLIEPTLVYGHPIEISPLAKPMDSDPRFVERFEIFIAGMECGDNWTEQNDPVHLLETWKRARAAGGDEEETHPLDYDFIEALEYGMAPTTGIGPGIERMAMIFTGQENIDDVVFFPMMKPVVSQVNKAIYGIEDRASALDQDLEDALTLDDFGALLRSGALRPRGDHVTLLPHLRVWPAGAEPRATAHVAIEGLASNRVLSVTGFSTAAAEPEARTQLAAWVAAGIASPLRTAHPHCRVETVEKRAEGVEDAGPA
jgi:lysyl-tRNA synthetase class 2